MYETPACRLPPSLPAEQETTFWHAAAGVAVATVPTAATSRGANSRPALRPVTRRIDPSQSVLPGAGTPGPHSSLPEIGAPGGGFAPDASPWAAGMIPLRASRALYRGSVQSAPLLLTCETFQVPPLFVSVTVTCDFVPFEPGRLVPALS